MSAARRPFTWPDALLTAVALPLGVLGGGLAGADHPLTARWILVLIVLAWLPLTMRLRRPVPVLLIVVAVDTVHIAAIGHAHRAVTLVPIATMLAVYTLASRGSNQVAWSITALTALVQFGAGAISHWGTSDLLYLNWAVVAAVIGRLMKERRDRIAAADLRAENAELTKQAEAARQVTAERLRIAHELHDVLAHHIALVNAQAGVAQYLLDTDPTAAATALAGITSNSRAALDELRATLGLLRAEGDSVPEGRRAPAPTIDQLDRLLAGFTDAGMRLTTSTHGSPGPLSSTAELAFYRIVQEALTNATKHAPGSVVSVHVEWAATTVTITITNTGAPTGDYDGGLMNQGTGHGLIGIRERAAIAYGSATATSTVGGGFQVVAVLPRLDSPEQGVDGFGPKHDPVPTR